MIIPVKLNGRLICLIYDKSRFGEQEIEIQFQYDEDTIGSLFFLHKSDLYEFMDRNYEGWVIE